MEIIKQSPGVLKWMNSPLVVSCVGKSRIWGVSCPFRAMLHHQVADSAKRATVLRYAEGNSWGAGSIQRPQAFPTQQRRRLFAGHATSGRRDEDGIDIMLDLRRKSKSTGPHASDQELSWGDTTNTDRDTQEWCERNNETERMAGGNASFSFFLSPTFTRVRFSQSVKC